MLIHACILAAVLCQPDGQPVVAAPGVFFQAHRGGVDEVPENTLPAFEHAWKIPGAVPEADLQTTSDGVIVLIHDDTPARTTDAPEPWASKKMREIPYAEISQWDAGVKFNESFRGTRIPTLLEVLDLMAQDRSRQMYFDMKAVKVDTVLELIRKYEIEKQVIFVHGSTAACLKLSRLYPGARTMTWLSGTPEQVRAKWGLLKEKGFEGISQLQFHLPVQENSDPLAYVLDETFLRQAVEELSGLGKALQLRPMKYTPQSLAPLLKMGVSWFVTDAPADFHKNVVEAQALLAADKN